MVSRPSPSLVYSVEDLSGLDLAGILFAVSEASTTLPGDEGGGVLFGAWSADGELVALTFGTWGGTTAEYEPILEAWSG